MADGFFLDWDTLNSYHKFEDGIPKLSADEEAGVARKGTSITLNQEEIYADY